MRYTLEDTISLRKYAEYVSVDIYHYLLMINLIKTSARLTE